MCEFVMPTAKISTNTPNTKYQIHHHTNHSQYIIVLFCLMHIAYKMGRTEWKMSQRRRRKKRQESHTHNTTPSWTQI